MTALGDVRSSAPKLHETQNCMPVKGDATEMPEGFAPSEFDVLVGWARQNFHHAGNRRFRDLISENVPRYVEADSKVARGHIIAEIVGEMQRSSPSGTGFLKMNPYSARWTFIGIDKAKDKVGHALRKALMSSEAEELRESDDSMKQSRGGNESKTMARDPAGSPIVSKKRKATARGHCSANSSVSSSILSKSPKYTGYQGPLLVDAVSSTPANEADLTSLSRFFTTPDGQHLPRQLPPSSGENNNPNYDPPFLGLSPVARDMFDEKHADSSEGPSRRSRTKVVSSDTSNISLQRDLDQEHHDHQDRSRRGRVSYPEQRAAAAGGAGTTIVPPPTPFPAPGAVAPHHSMYAPPPPPPPPGSAPYYYHPSSMEHSPAVPPMRFPPSRGAPLSPAGGGATSRMPPPHQIMPPGAAAQIPPPPGMYYHAPGYYYYHPGYMPPPPPGAGANSAPPFYPPPPYYPPPPPHHHHHHHQLEEQGEDDELNSPRPNDPLPSPVAL